MLGLLIRWLLGAVALFLTTKIVPGLHITDAQAVLFAVLVLGLLNAVIRPIVNFFTGCLQILTLGLLTLVINALFFWWAGNLVNGFEVTGFWPAFWGSIVMSIISFLLSMFVRTDKQKKDEEKR
jgi:putative membrane protein